MRKNLTWKLLASLLTLCMVLTVLPVSARAEVEDKGEECKETDSCTHVASYGEKHFKTLQGAVTASEADTNNTGEHTVTVLKDVTDLSASVAIAKSVIIDLQNHRIAAPSGNYVFRIAKSATDSDLEEINVTIKDGSLGAANADDLSNAGRGIRFNSTGKLIVSNVQINVKDFAVANRAGGTAELINCTVKSKIVAISNVNEVSTEKGDGSMTITGGTYECDPGAESAWLIRIGGKNSQLSIKGGSFTNKSTDAGASTIVNGYDNKENDTTTTFDGGTLIIGTENNSSDTITITSTGAYGIAAHYGAKVTIGNGVTVNAYGPALGGNNTAQTENFTVNAGAKLTSTHNAAIFMPSAGELTINGGEITGLTGICALLGKITINEGAVIKATAPENSFTDGQFDESYLSGDSGPRWNGSALLMVTNKYKSEATGADFSLTINGGEFTATDDGKAVDVKKGTKEAGNGIPEFSASITGGTFSSDVSDYVAENYKAVEKDGNFEVKAVKTLTLDPTEGGSFAEVKVDGVEATPTDDTLSVAEGQKVTFKVTANEGYVLQSVTAGTDALTAEDGVYTYTMGSAEATITATFAKTYTVTITQPTGATITAKVNDTEAAVAAAGDKVQLEFAKQDGYEFVSVSVKDAEGNDVAVDNYAFTMPTSNVTITAEFKKVTTYTITAETLASGTVIADKATAQMGETVTLTVTPKEGYEISLVGYKPDDDAGQLIHIPNQDGTYSFKMPAHNVAVWANFDPISYKVEVTNPGGGSVGFSVNDEAATTANVGDTIVVMPQPLAGYKVEEVKYNNTVMTASEDGKYTFAMPAKDVTITVTFTEIPKLTTENVTINPTSDNLDNTATEIALPTVTVTGANEGTDYTVAWTKDNAPFDAEKITEPGTYTVTVTATDTGVVSGEVSINFTVTKDGSDTISAGATAEKDSDGNVTSATATVDDASKIGTDEAAKAGALTIVATTSDDAPTTEVTLSKDVVNAIAGEETANTFDTVIKTDAATVTLPSEAMKVAKEADENVKLVVKKEDKSKETIEDVQGKPTASFDISLVKTATTTDGDILSETKLEGGKLSEEITLELYVGVQTGKPFVYYHKGNEYIPVPGATYDSGYVTVTTNHLSKYVVTFSAKREVSIQKAEDVCTVSVETEGTPVEGEVLTVIIDCQFGEGQGATHLTSAQTLTGDNITVDAYMNAAAADVVTVWVVGGQVTTRDLVANDKTIPYYSKDSTKSEG